MQPPPFIYPLSCLIAGVPTRSALPPLIGRSPACLALRLGSTITVPSYTLDVWWFVLDVDVNRAVAAALRVGDVVAGLAAEIPVPHDATDDRVNLVLVGQHGAAATDVLQLGELRRLHSRELVDDGRHALEPLADRNGCG
jgi:hypothetical protein